MAIPINFVVSPHQTTIQTGDGQDMMFISGIAGVGLSGHQGAWRREELTINVGPRWRNGPWVAPMAALAAVATNGGAPAAGWAVDSCTAFARSNVEEGYKVFLSIRVAIADPEAVLLRISLQVALVGMLR